MDDSFYYELDLTDPDSIDERELVYTEDDTINLKSTKWD